jgi:hypothetical protein
VSRDVRCRQYRQVATSTMSGGRGGATSPGRCAVARVRRHGEQVVDVTQQELTITPQVIVYPAAARVIRPTYLPLWTFRQTLPPPPPDWYQPRLERAYTARVAGREVQLVLDDTVEWMGRF